MQSITRTRARLVAVACLAIVPFGCTGGESHIVQINYTLEPSKSLPAGLKSVAVMQAELTPATDPQWSHLASNMLIRLLREGNELSGGKLTVVARDETRKVMAEADLAAAGLVASARPGADPKLAGIEAFILSRIDVKVEKHKGRGRTISAVNVGHWFRGYRGGGAIRTQEVETVSRTMTVHSTFQLVDSHTSVVLESSSEPYQGTEATSVSPFFGSSQTEAALTPEDRVIGTLVERGVREFVGKLLPLRIREEVALRSSRNEDCAQGVRLLRADMYEESLARFQAAVAANSGDDRALFGAGVACELAGRYSEALRYYRLACVQEGREEYLHNKDRLASHLGRIRRD